MPGTSLQPKLSRVRPPRVRILTSLAEAADPNAPELPFHIAVIAPLAGQAETSTPYRERRFVEIDRDTFDVVLSSLAPQLRLTVDNKLTDDDTRLRISLDFRSLDDFGPNSVAQQVAPLRELLKMRANLADLGRMIHHNDLIEELLNDAVSSMTADSDLAAAARRIASEGRLARTEEEVDFAAARIVDFLEAFRRGEVTWSRDMESAIQSHIAILDELVSRQVNQVLHDPAFQALEATWRGLAHLVGEAETSSSHRIYVLSASRKEILQDLRHASDYRDLELYAKLSQPLDTLGGAPFGCVVFDFRLERDAQDLTLMEALAKIGAAICAPVLACPDASWFAEGSARNLSVLNPEPNPRWDSFRRREYSRFLVMVLPRMLLRQPYGRDNAQVEGFNFEEAVWGTDISPYLWGNPPWALAARISAAWTTYGWCAAIQGREGGGMVQDLPLHRFNSDEGDLQCHPVTEFVVTERMEAELFDQGFCSLCQFSQRGEAVFPRVPTCRRPGGFLEAEANWNDRFGAQLAFVLSFCRFALAVRMMVRDNRSLFSTPAQCEEKLNQWLSRYVLADDTATASAKAAFPLREGHIVLDRGAHDDEWVAALFLRPYFQLDGLTVPLRMLLDLRVS
ncbi:MAG TPA: type VI secretion system contractile sheath large subunit [Candidatus Sulfopaludibacter sp.]|jgi:type VI secretion system protein ImpC|nr:type VI secretion system contractile sheath large subunit [Candidatus Sulfopaludibacter sp.]